MSLPTARRDRLRSCLSRRWSCARSRPPQARSPRPPPGNRQTLIIVTPHIEQIREEFGAAFATWNAKHFPSEPPVYIDWRVPGGTTEILRLLQAVYQAQLGAPSLNTPPTPPAPRTHDST